MWGREASWVYTWESCQLFSFCSPQWKEARKHHCNGRKNRTCSGLLFAYMELTSVIYKADKITANGTAKEPIGWEQPMTVFSVTVAVFQLYFLLAVWIQRNMSVFTHASESEQRLTTELRKRNTCNYNCAPTAPVSMSYINAPKLHQSTARLCPLLIKISGALKLKKTNKHIHSYFLFNKLKTNSDY